LAVVWWGPAASHFALTLSPSRKQALALSY
jgi:hypothetical protein